MFEILHPGASLGWDYLWQSTLFLGLGLAASARLDSAAGGRIAYSLWSCSPRSPRRSSRKSPGAAVGGSWRLRSRIHRSWPP